MDDEQIARSLWEVQVDNLIGGWCVMVKGSPTPVDGGYEIASFVSEAVARHIAELHNDWLRPQETCGKCTHIQEYHSPNFGCVVQGCPQENDGVCRPFIPTGNYGRTQP